MNGEQIRVTMSTCRHEDNQLINNFAGDTQQVMERLKDQNDDDDDDSVEVTFEPEPDETGDVQ